MKLFMVKKKKNQGGRKELKWIYKQPEDEPTKLLTKSTNITL